MVFYGILGVVVLGLAWWMMRSPLFRAHLRGHGDDPQRWGNRYDHLADNGTGASWRSDGSGGDRESRIRPPHTRR